MNIFKRFENGPLLDIVVLCNFVITVVLAGLLLLAVRPSEVQITVLRESAEIKQMIQDNADQAKKVSAMAETNAVAISNLTAAGTDILSELKLVRASLTTLYESLIELIKLRTDDRYTGSMADEDWRSAAESTEGLQLPERLR